MGDQPHLFVFHIPGNLPHNLESLENSGFGLSSEGKELSVKIATFMYLFPLPTGKWESHGWCSRTELKHDLHLPHPFSPAKRKVLAMTWHLEGRKKPTGVSPGLKINTRQRKCRRKGHLLLKAKLREDLLTAAQVTAPTSLCSSLHCCFKTLSRKGKVLR